MCCNDYKYNLHEYSTGQLNELERHAVAKHLKSCEKCRRELEEISELKAFLKPMPGEVPITPMDLKADIMGSISPKRYKSVYQSTLGELANWGMSLVAAGLILLLVNVTPAGNLGRVHNGFDINGQSIEKKISQPFSTINKGFYKFTSRITELDGITGRMEREKKGGN